MTTPESIKAPLRFLVRPLPLKGEGLRGYVLRVAELNGLGPGTGWYMALTQRKQGYMVTNEVIDAIANALDKPPELIKSISYRKLGKGEAAEHQYSYFGHNISKHHLRSLHPAICPHCLAEQQALSGLWDFRAVCACPHHGNWLIDQCPGCGKLLSWHRKSITQCTCGFDLSTAPTEPAPENILVFTRLLHEQVLNDLPSHEERALRYPAELRQASLNDVLGLLRFTSRALMPGPGGRQRSNARDVEGIRRHKSVVMILARALRDWPNGLWWVLYSLSLAGPDIDVHGPISIGHSDPECYGRVLAEIYDAPTMFKKMPKFFREELRRFIYECSPYLFISRESYFEMQAQWRGDRSTENPVRNQNAAEPAIA